MRLVQRPCRKLLHSQCRGSVGLCYCPCHWEAVLARYGPPFPRTVPDGTVRLRGGEWGQPAPRPGLASRALAAWAVANPWMWRQQYWWWTDHCKLVFHVWRQRRAARSQGPQGLDAG